MKKSTSNKRVLIEWLRKEVRPASGCTEPVAIAFAAATAAKYTHGDIFRIQGKISRNLYKNADGVTLPATNSCGVHLAAAIGAIGGDASLSLDVLRNIQPEHITLARKLIDNQSVCIESVDSSEIIYVDMTIMARMNQCRVIIEGSHTHITHLSVDGVERNPVSRREHHNTTSDAFPLFSVKDAFDFICHVDYQHIYFMFEAVRLNSALSREGKKAPYGLNVSGALRNNIADGFCSNNLMNQIVMDATAASDARMGGASIPAMTNFGSGNQGIAATMPVVTLAGHLQSSEEELVRAVTLSHLVAISIHARYERLSALCAASTAAMGAAAGMAWLLTRDYTVITYAIKNMISDVSGIICDGASGSCAMKISSVVSSAIKSVLMAKNHRVAGSHDGIIHDDVEQTINALCQLATSSMKYTDKQIIQIMSDKKL